jgi:hypothetical protein
MTPTFCSFTGFADCVAIEYRSGMIAPIIGGALFSVDISFPVYVSIFVMLLSTTCVLLLREDAGAATMKGGKGGLMH